MNFDEKLMNRYFARLCDENEDRKVKEWFASTEGQAYLSADMEEQIKKWDGEKEGVVDHEIPTEVMFDRVVKEIRRGERKKWYVWAAVMILPLIVTASLVSLLFSSSEKKVVAYREVVVAKGEQLQVLMQDGTRVWLNADSRLVYPDNFNNKERVVKLDGEAYFEVAKNSKRPFRVELEAMNIQVTGTSFNVKAYPEDSLIQTCLSEGAIQLQNKIIAEGGSLAMKPGEIAFFSKHNGTCRIDTTDDTGSFSAWKGDHLVFKKTPLKEVLKVLERKFDQDFEVKDPALYAYSYTISFHHENLKDILKGLERITPIRVVFYEDKYNVYGRDIKN